MITGSNFIVRSSGRKENSYYIDYLGSFKTSEIARMTGIKNPSIKEKYLANGAVYFEELDVYYFNNIDDAKKAIKDILKDIKAEKRGKAIFLTDAEIEYLRKVLINDSMNNLSVKEKFKESIFKKLNT